MDKITLKGMEFYARHGAMKEEQILGQKFTVDITMYLSLDKAGADDDLEKTVNYAKVYSFCRKIVEGAPVRLIERLAWILYFHGFQYGKFTGNFQKGIHPHFRNSGSFSRKGIVYLQYKTLGENRSAGFPERSASDNL